MWPIILSNRLPIVALVGRYPANKLMGRGLIPARKLASRGLLSPHCKTRAYPVLSTVSSRYSSCRGRLSTRYSPVRHSTRGRSPFRVRLACVKHAASVQSEPESNSPVQICSRSLLGRNQNLKVVLFPFALRLSMNQRAAETAQKAECLFVSGLSTVYMNGVQPTPMIETLREYGCSLVCCTICSTFTILSFRLLKVTETQDRLGSILVYPYRFSVLPHRSKHGSHRLPSLQAQIRPDRP